MHYPWWYVPYLTSPMLIAIVATLHVFVAMFAVGGGFVLAWGIRTGYQQGDREWLAYYYRFSWFFLLITVVYGAITGVGVWWTIGLASPLATEELIHIFVFIWAVEYSSFIVELVAAFVLFYGWHRLDPTTHRAAAWAYAGAAWASLVFITGITAFMLNTGGWPDAGTAWRAFWNPQTAPQIIARTGTSLLLAALFVFLHAAFVLAQDDALRWRVARQVAQWAMLGGGLVIVGGIWWYLAAPPAAKAALVAAASLNILVALIFALTGTVIVMLYLGPYRHPNWVTPGFALLFFALGFAATATGEFVREAVRKPFVVYDRILGQGTRPADIAVARRQGFLESGVWTRPYVADRYPQVVAPSGHIANDRLLALSPQDRRQVGRVIFMYHCNDCHAVNGYSGVSQLTRGWTRDMTYTTVTHLNRAHFFMPPWSGTEPEAQVLTDYLQSISRPFPPGLPPPGGPSQ